MLSRGVLEHSRIAHRATRTVRVARVRVDAIYILAASADAVYSNALPLVFISSL